jgi:hypothetical protein
MKGRGGAEKNEQIPIEHTVWFRLQSGMQK